MSSFTTRSSEETRGLGRSFAASIKPGDVIALFGNLGSGKTQFVAGVCDGLGVARRATSPTFTIINEYASTTAKVAHIDLYRLSSRRELAELGIEEYFDGETICLIEWAESILDLLPDSYYLVKIAYGAGEHERIVIIEQGGQGGAGISRAGT